jgi:hypothetical protein
MHAPRARNRSKYRAGTLLTPQQQCKAALKLIDPAPEQYAKCETEVTAYIGNILAGKITERQYREDQKQEPQRNLIRKLRAVELAGINQLSKALLEKIKIEREFLEQDLKWLSAQHQHGGRQPNLQMVKATLCAWILLNQYGHKPPPLTAGELWHQLAAALFGTEVGSFSFDYLRDSRLHEKKEARPI